VTSKSRMSIRRSSSRSVGGSLRRPNFLPVARHEANIDGAKFRMTSPYVALWIRSDLSSAPAREINGAVIVRHVKRDRYRLNKRTKAAESTCCPEAGTWSHGGASDLTAMGVPGLRARVVAGLARCTTLPSSMSALR
jgi:hypothetical protein